MGSLLGPYEKQHTPTNMQPHLAISRWPAPGGSSALADPPLQTKNKFNRKFGPHVLVERAPNHHSRNEIVSYLKSITHLLFKKGSIWKIEVTFSFFVKLYHPSQKFTNLQYFDEKIVFWTYFRNSSCFCHFFSTLLKTWCFHSFERDLKRYTWISLMFILMHLSVLIFN